MPPSAEPLADDGAPPERAKVPRFFGGRCAQVLGGLLLALLTVTNVTRWLAPDTAFRMEKIVQQPVAPETATFSSPSPDAIAPDPGDTSQ